MNRYFEEFITGIEQRAYKNDGIVEMNDWFHHLSFDVFNRIFEASLTNRLLAP
jgi:hypothetical protein